MFFFPQTMLPQELCRFLSFAALKETYCDCPEALDDGMQLVATDLVNLMQHGLDLRCGDSVVTLRLAVTGVKGDWPWLIEAGHLSRHFRRAPKRGESTMVAGGVCHLCLGGVHGFPFEDFSASPTSNLYMTWYCIILYIVSNLILLTFVYFFNIVHLIVYIDMCNIWLLISRDGDGERSHMEHDDNVSN